MKIAIAILRITILLSLGTVAMYLFFCQENDESELSFLLHFIFDKAIATMLAYIGIRLYNRWAIVDMCIAWFDSKNRIDTDAVL